MLLGISQSTFSRLLDRLQNPYEHLTRSNGIEHSVTQSSFNDPCVRLAASGNNTGGFDSTLTAGTTFTIMITDTNRKRSPNVWKAT